MLFSLAVCCAMLASAESRAQEMIHRYSFDSDANDLVGTAHGELVGNAVITNGAVVLDGVHAYVNLPNDLVSTLTDASIEVWVTWNGGSPWQRIFDFGNTGADEDVQTAAAQSIFLTPNNGSVIDLSIFPETINTQQVITGPPLTPGGLHHVVWTYDAETTTGRLYVDGEEVGVNNVMTHTLASLGPTVNNWIGHSQYIQDADFSGSIAEFRIYNGPLTAETVATNFLTGPDPSGRGELVGITLVARPLLRPGGSQQLQVLADYERASGLDVTAEPQVTFETSDPSVFTITAGGLLQSIGSTNGTAVITAAYLGKSASQTIQVAVAEPAEIIHRYSFDSDASDSVGTAHGELVGNALVQNGILILDGSDGYVNLPNDILGGLTNVTIEVWTTWNGGSPWQRLFDFGNSTNGEDEQGAATQSIFLTPSNGGSMVLSMFPNGIGGQQAINASPLSPGVRHHVVWTYDTIAGTAWLFVDGVQVGINTAMTYTLPSLGPLLNNWIGHSQYTQDADYAGEIDEFRIYNGVLSAEKVAASLLDGPNQQGTGALTAVRIEAPSAMRPGSSRQLRVLADYERVAGVDVTSDPTVVFEVSDPGILSVAPNGLLTAVATGDATATVTAKFGGQTATHTIQVVLPQPAELIHRYSFEEDASDSVGDADGVLVGNALIDNGAVVLDGEDAYVDLPNGLVSGLTNATIEVWVTWNGGPPWQRIFDFGNSTSSEDLQGAAVQSIFLTPNNGSGMVLSIFPDGIGGQHVVTGPALAGGALQHIAWTYDAVAATGKLFVNGLPVGVNTNMTHTLAGLGETVNNWLGHSQYVQDADFAGSIAEFRIYNGALSDALVTASYVAGPDELPDPNSGPVELAAVLSDTQLRISWPESATGFTLESSPALGPAAAWAAVNADVQTVNGQNQVVVPVSDTARFYRLRQ